MTLSARPLGNFDTFFKGLTCNLALSHFLGQTSQKTTLYIISALTVKRVQYTA